MSQALPLHLYASAIQLEISAVFVAQFLLFGLFITLLKPLLFDPLIRVFEERERRTEGAKAQAREMDAEAGELLQRYEAEVARVRREAGIERDRLRAETAKLEARIMAEARAETSGILETGKARVAAEVADLRKDLEAQKPQLAAQIAARILGREVASVKRSPMMTRASGGWGADARPSPSPRRCLADPRRPRARPASAAPRRATPRRAPRAPGRAPADDHRPRRPRPGPAAGQPPAAGRPPRLPAEPPRVPAVAERPPRLPAAPGRPLPGFPPPAHVATHEAVAEEHGHAGGEHECPGHGAEDPPPDPNLWHGLLGVNNERALSGRFVDQLLYRYNNPKDPCDPRNEPPPFSASLINFAILALILYRYGRKPLSEALAKRKTTITAEIDLATKLKSDAEARLDEYEDRLENIEGKLDEVRAEYAAQAEVEKKHILAEAEERRVRMRRDAELRVEQELKAMRDELLHEAVIAATAAAEALVLKQMSSADHDRMAQDYLASIGASLSAGGPS